jgi:peptide/nickel transport system permease protein
MLNAGRAHLYRAPWLGIFPGVAITTLVLSLNFLADALQITMNPATERGAGESEKSSHKR